MSWRSVQLGNSLCNQDQLILDLFQKESVNCVGTGPEFTQYLNYDPQSKNLVLIINYAHWVSDILKICQENLTDNIECVYFSVNRYYLLGNDTDIIADNVVELLSQIVSKYGFKVIKKSNVEKDLGRYFNFIQPLTWVYGNKITN